MESWEDGWLSEHEVGVRVSDASDMPATRNCYQVFHSIIADAVNAAFAPDVGERTSDAASSASTAETSGYLAEYRVTSELASHPLNNIALLTTDGTVLQLDRALTLIQLRVVTGALWRYESGKAREATRGIAIVRGRSVQEADALASRVPDRTEASNRVIQARQISSEAIAERGRQRSTPADQVSQRRVLAKLHLDTATATSADDASCKSALATVYNEYYRHFVKPPAARVLRNIVHTHSRYEVGVQHCLLSGRVGRYLGYTTAPATDESGEAFVADQHVFLSCGTNDGFKCPAGTLLCRHGHTAAELEHWSYVERGLRTGIVVRPTDGYGEATRAMRECRECCFPHVGLRWPVAKGKLAKAYDTLGCRGTVLADPRPPPRVSYWDLLEELTPPEPIEDLLSYGSSDDEDYIIGHRYVAYEPPRRSNATCDERSLKRQKHRQHSTPAGTDFYYLPDSGRRVCVGENPQRIVCGHAPLPHAIRP